MSEKYVIGLDYGTLSGRGVLVRVIAKNDGKADTQDVVQVYCQNEGSENAPRNPRLCAFKRVDVPAGASVTAELVIPEERFLVVDEEGKRIAQGDIVLYAGAGQPDALTERLTGHKAVCCRL